MDFHRTNADGDVYIRASKKADGFEYYEMLLVYVDDVIAVSHRPGEIIESIAQLYRLKDKPGAPEIFLGADIKQWDLPDGKRCWAMSAGTYLKRALATVDKMLAEDNSKLAPTAKTPFRSGYRPEVDITPELSVRFTQRYQQLIGILRWLVELGRIDIMTEVSMLSSHNALPRQGHLEAVYHVFSYLASHSRSTVVFNDRVPQINT
ncbi:hypothetical protein ACA910_015599 [Epithemia clementina (nom. ined.)]